MYKRLLFILLIGFGHFKISILPTWAEKVAVLYHRSMPAYQEIIKGLEQEKEFTLQIISFGEDFTNNPKKVQTLLPADVKAVIIFSQETLSLVESGLPDIPTIYTMVLEPYTFASKRRAAGLLIQPSVAKQFELISKVFPGRNKVVVIYDPNYTGKIINSARLLAKNHGLILSPVAVQNKNEIFAFLN